MAFIAYRNDVMRKVFDDRKLPSTVEYFLVQFMVTLTKAMIESNYFSHGAAPHVTFAGAVENIPT